MNSLGGDLGLEMGEQPEREKGAHGQSVGMQTTCPKMCTVRKTTSVRGRQEELPRGGSLAWDGGRWGKSRILPSGRHTGPAGGGGVLRVEKGVPRRPFRNLRWRLLHAQGGLSQVTGKKPSQMSVQWSGT